MLKKKKKIGPNLVKKDPKVGYFAFFENFVIYFSKKKYKMEVLDSWLSIGNPMSGKIFLVDQIAGFFKVKKNWRIQLILCLQINILFPDKQIFLQIIIIAIDGLGQACPKYPK